MLLPSKIMGFLSWMTSVWWLGHEHDLLNHTPPTVIHFRQHFSGATNIMFLSEVRQNTEVKTVANFRLMQTLFFFYASLK